LSSCHATFFTATPEHVFFLGKEKNINCDFSLVIKHMLLKIPEHAVSTHATIASPSHAGSTLPSIGLRPPTLGLRRTDQVCPITLCFEILRARLAAARSAMQATLFSEAALDLGPFAAQVGG
jgi:hypothetical protein